RSRLSMKHARDSGLGRALMSSIVSSIDCGSVETFGSSGRHRSEGGLGSSSGSSSGRSRAGPSSSLSPSEASPVSAPESSAALLGAGVASLGGGVQPHAHRLTARAPRYRYRTIETQYPDRSEEHTSELQSREN